ncbi:hypothetical protein CYMTET_12845 [Cymbomonas tetramitiformis]|uniref:Uncharacterized protein n=1 Tax=Cymbomonas tetramitiformis TaxID=36881 RepID=A0AAE0GJW6_9CHLO|nr:hypothetical protein CYMTET_12845 [Cymbomonas tetramitiformis]
MPDGKPQLQSRPGEIWMRKNLKDKQPWVILDLRRNAPKDHRQWGKGARTRDVPVIEGILPITDSKFQLYHAPLPITKEKVQDLHKLSKYLPDEAKAALYPAYVEGMVCKGAEVVAEEPDEEEPDNFEEPVPALACAAGPSAENNSGDDASVSESESSSARESSSEDEGPLSERVIRSKGAA